MFMISSCRLCCSLLRYIGTDEQLVLHDIKDIHRDAFAAYHRRSKASPVPLHYDTVTCPYDTSCQLLNKMEEMDSNVAILRARRPQSANIIAEIVAEEKAKAARRMQKERQRQRIQRDAWGSTDLPEAMEIGEFPSLESDDRGVHHRHIMLPDSELSRNDSSVEGANGFKMGTLHSPQPIQCRTHTSHGGARARAVSADSDPQYRPVDK